MKLLIKNEYDYLDFNKPKIGLFLILKRLLKIKGKRSKI